MALWIYGFVDLSGIFKNPARTFRKFIKDYKEIYRGRILRRSFRGVSRRFDKDSPGIHGAFTFAEDLTGIHRGSFIRGPG